MNMNQFYPIKDNEGLQKFIRDVDGFHDAVLHEVMIQNPGYVDESFLMHGDNQLPRAALLFQSQFPEIAAIELQLTNISIFRLAPTHDFMLEGDFGDDEIVLYPAGRKSLSKAEIRCSGAAYRMLGKNFLGPTYRLTGLPQ